VSIILSRFKVYFIRSTQLWKKWCQ